MKVFALTAALRLVGEDLFDRVGREPSGDPFNSLVQLEAENGIPRNPFINAGALVVTDHLGLGGIDKIILVRLRFGRDREPDRLGARPVELRPVDRAAASADSARRRGRSGRCSAPSG